MEALIQGIIKLITEFGLGQGIFIVLVLGILYYLYQRNNILTKEVLETKDNEIKRLSEENKEYRNMFQNLIKKDLNIKEEELELKQIVKKELKR